MVHKLIELPYSVDALNKVIGNQTIECHWGKHLKTYVDNLNKLIAGTEFENLSLEEIVAKSEGGIYNNAGQTLNHNLYFLQLTPNSKSIPQGKLLDEINKTWGSFEAFQEAFSKAAVTLFGSGWVWLSKKPCGSLVIAQYPNAGNPIKDGNTPLLGIDVWEHAYYLDYQNRRADHVKDFWSIINWDVVIERYNK